MLIDNVADIKFLIEQSYRISPIKITKQNLTV